MSDLLETQTEVENIKSELNNLQIQINKVKENMNSETRSNNKKSAELTNNELATADYPLDKDLKQSDIIRIQTSVFQNFENSLQKVQNNIAKLNRSADSISDVMDMSSTVNQIYSRIYDMKDRFESRVCENFNINNNAKILQYVDKNPNNCYILKVHEEDFENELTEIERLSKELYNLSRDIIQLISNTDEDAIKDEIEESRMNQAQKEFEEMEPYMDLKRIKDIFDTNREVNISEIKTRLNKNTSLEKLSYDEDSVRKIIENAVNTTPDHTEYNVEKISNDKYRITQN